MAQVDATNKGCIAEMVDQRKSATLFLNFISKIVSKRRLLHDCFSVNFVKFISIAFLKERLETAGNILKSQAFYRSLLNRNVPQFTFIFFKESFL